MCDILKKIKNKTADEILKEYYGNLTIPIDIVCVAKNIGIHLSAVDFSDMEQDDLFKEKVHNKGNILGMVEVDGNDVNISYRNNFYDNEFGNNLSEAEKKRKLKNRQRFTIAHEIAHCCLHMADKNGGHIEYRREQDSFDKPIEKAANIMAGQLLMPDSIILSILAAFDYIVPIDYVSDLFKVSRKVLKARVDYLIEKNLISEDIVYI